MFVGLVVLVAALGAIAFTLPRSVHVERSILIDAPRSVVYALADGMPRFNEWSPWRTMEPGAKWTLEGPAHGVGSKQRWEGKKLGTGTQEIVEVKRNESVRSSLDFGGHGTAVALMTLMPEGSGTKVVWGFDSDSGNNPIGRYMGLMMDRMLGPTFDQGLTALKGIAEKLPKIDFATLEPATVDVQAVPIAFVATTSPKDPGATAMAIGGSYMQIGKFMKQNGLKQAGAVVTVDTRWDEVYGFDAAVPIDQQPASPPGAASPVQVRKSYGGRALKVVHKGSYAGLASTREQIQAYAAANAIETAGPMWDEYVSDPGTTPEAELITNIYQPIK
jgi:effector-binding domain-containing protein